MSHGKRFFLLTISFFLVIFLVKFIVPTSSTSFVKNFFSEKNYSGASLDAGVLGRAEVVAGAGSAESSLGSSESSTRGGSAGDGSSSGGKSSNRSSSVNSMGVEKDTDIPSTHSQNTDTHSSASDLHSTASNQHLSSSMLHIQNTEYPNLIERYPHQEDTSFGPPINEPPTHNEISTTHFASSVVHTEGSSQTYVDVLGNIHYHLEDTSWTEDKPPTHAENSDTHLGYTDTHNPSSLTHSLISTHHSGASSWCVTSNPTPWDPDHYEDSDVHNQDTVSHTAPSTLYGNEPLYLHSEDSLWCPNDNYPGVDKPDPNPDNFVPILYPYLPKHTATSAWYSPLPPFPAETQTPDQTEVSGADEPITLPAEGSSNLDVIQINGELSVGSFGPEVVALQYQLVKQGLLSVKHVTAYFGNITKKALETFQVAYNLTSEKGVVGPKTREVLNNAL